MSILIFGQLIETSLTCSLCSYRTISRQNLPVAAELEWALSQGTRSPCQQAWRHILVSKRPMSSIINKDSSCWVWHNTTPLLTKDSFFTADSSYLLPSLVSPKTLCIVCIWWFGWAFLSIGCCSLKDMNLNKDYGKFHGSKKTLRKNQWMQWRALNVS